MVPIKLPVNPPSRRHALRRTSPKGTPFVGTCIQCGKVGLTTKDMQEECPNIRGLTEDEALLEVLDAPRDN